LGEFLGTARTPFRDGGGGEALQTGALAFDSGGDPKLGSEDGGLSQYSREAFPNVVGARDADRRDINVVDTGKHG